MSTLHQDTIHESGYRHTSGEARYVDDLAGPHGTLVGWIVTSTVACGAITNRCAQAAQAMPGIHAVLFADDIPGHNRIGPIVHDEPVLADEVVHYIGQPVALVLGETYEAVRDAAETVIVEYTSRPAILSIAQAIDAQSFHGDPHVIARGDVDATLAQAAVRIEQTVSTGGQDHFYLETHAALVVPQEDGQYHVHSSTQHPTEVQFMVAEVLGISSHQVVCEVARMGGGFGGKESQASTFAALAALGSHATGRAVKVWLNREADMTITGKRHPFWSQYQAGFDADGRLLALKVQIYSDGGFTEDLSIPVMDRALFHLDNTYWVPALRFEGRVCKTNLPSNTAYRGFGGPQGIYVIEDAINRFAERTGVDPAAIRRLNFYGDAPKNRAPYGQEIPFKGNRLARIDSELMKSSDYQGRRAQIDAFNAQSAHIRRGLGYQLVKFGISFTKSLLNQAGALVLIYRDGSVQLNHGGTEMGQGLHTKMLAICAHELGITVDRIRIMNTATDKVPNTSPTAASSGSDLNGQAVADACRTLIGRMTPIAAQMLGCKNVEFRDGGAHQGEKSVDFADVALQCWLQQVSLAATGYYATPGITYDHTTGSGTPFYYYAYGAAVTEVEVSLLTGEHRIRRVDILHDVGNPLVPSIDRGQVEGAFVQGVGWLTCEELLFRDDGAPITVGPSTYKIPAIGDVPVDFRVALLERAPSDLAIHGSKAVGEPPFVLGISVVTALRHALSSIRSGEVELAVPCTPEAILRATING